MSEVYDSYQERAAFLKFTGIRDKRILDVGAGEGLSAIVATKEFDCAVVVIEPSKEKIGIARENACRYGVEKKIVFMAGDIIQSGLDEDSFDYVVCYNVLHHIPLKQRGKALEEMYRIARYGLVISELNQNGIHLFDTVVHPDKNHKRMKVDIDWLETQLVGLGEVVKREEGKLTNFYWLKK